MRLWKRGPTTFGVLALATLVVDFALNMIPAGGVVLAQIAVPLAACGLLYGSLAADRGGRPRRRAFSARAGGGAPRVGCEVHCCCHLVLSVGAPRVGACRVLDRDPS